MSRVPDPLPPPWDGLIDLSSDEFFTRALPVMDSQPTLALAIAERAWRQAEDTRDEAGAIRALILKGHAHVVLGQQESDATLSEALRRAEALGEPTLLVRAVNNRMSIDIFQGQYAVALARGQSVLGLAHVLSRDDLLSRLLNNLGTALSLIGEFSMAIKMYEERLRLLPTAGDESKVQRTRSINNMAVAWLGLARAEPERDDAALPGRALARAKTLAEAACGRMLAETQVSLRLGTLDTLVEVLLERSEAGLALQWAQRVEAVSRDALQPSSVHWGSFHLPLCRIQLALGEAEMDGVLARLREIEALPGPKFRGGEMQAMLHHCLSQALERVGDYGQALVYHRRWLDHQARAQSVLAREHATAVRNTLDSLRGETEEFITHDLRNPLGAALVQMQSVAVAELPAPVREGVLRARQSVQRALDTAESYLSIVRTRHLRRAELKEVDLAELVDDVGERLAPPSGAAVRLERDVEWGMTVRGDRILLLMAFTKLLRNALRHSPAGTMVRLTLACEGHVARLSVIDEGPGIPEALRPRLLRRMPSGDTRRGRGLGLTMIARVAQLHDARLQLLPGPGGRGTAISLLFPLAEPGAEAG
jgi:signal transduction histidine kinase